MSQLERDDIQGIVLRGYEEMHAACFVLLEIVKKDNFKTFLAETDFRNAAIKPLRVRGDTAINIAFTRPGLDKLGVPRDTFRNVSREFFEGMLGHADDRSAAEGKRHKPGDGNFRQRMLGDIGPSAPSNWRWGNALYEFDEIDQAPGVDEHALLAASQDTGRDPVHVLLMLYAPEVGQLGTLYEEMAGGTDGLEHAFGLGNTKAEQPGESSSDEAGDDFRQHGARVLRVLSTRLLGGRKEHFGYRDGIGQPIVEGEETGSGVDPGNVVKPGEFLFGYRNEYGRYPISPRLNGNNDFGRNGSLLVFRQLAQDVPGFWGYIKKNAGEEAAQQQGGAARHKMIRLASKMVGRWPSGAPMVLAPDEDRPALEDENDFGFFDTDPKGHRCPFGSHARRSNPRDAFPGSSDKSSKHGRRHRIIRRGRAYGEAVPGFISDTGDGIEPLLSWKDFDSPFDTETEDAGPARIARGLHFICFNTNIARQFEFIQSTWIMNPKFFGLSRDPDPVCGEHGKPDSKDGEDQQAPPSQEDGDSKGAGHFRSGWKGGVFTLQRDPACKRMTGLRRYVHVHGGGYFFMPGLRALRHLADRQ